MYKYNLGLVKRDSEFKYYFLGLVASDGYISSKSNRIEISLKEADIGLLKVIRDVLCPGKKIAYKSKQRAYRLTLENKELKREVVKYINPKNKTFSLVFPYGIPKEYVNHFIRGYIDGDGTIGIVKGSKKVANGERHYYYGLRLRILGTRAFLYGLNMNLNLYCDEQLNSKPGKKGQENVYIIQYAFKSAEKVLKYIYKNATYYLERKKMVYNTLTTLDSQTIRNNYNTDKGRYNMQSTLIGKGIVDTNSNIGI